MAVTHQQHAQKVMSLMNAGQFVQAAKAAKAALKKFPREGNFANAAGMAMAQSGNLREAISFFSKALKITPGDPGVQDNLIQALVMTDQHTKANELIDKLLPRRADPSQLYHLKASSCARQGNPEAVIEAASKAIAASPKMSLSYNIRGIAHTDLGQDELAYADFEIAHELTPADPDPLANMGIPLSRLDRTDEAMVAIETALTLRPDHINANHRYAVQLAEVGRVEDAIAQYHKLLEIDPLHGEAYSELVLTQSKDRNAELEPKLRTAIAKSPKKAPVQIYLNLGMGNLLYQQGNFEQAGRFLAASNALSAQMRPYDRTVAEAEFDRIVSMFPAGDLAPETGDIDAPQPIFVLGQPRSGTTLTEMILTSHPDVQSCGELPGVGKITLPIVEGQETFDAATFAREYRQRLPKMDPGTLAFVDKMPANYRFIGFLLHAFPNAGIVHIARDPRDVALSMWRSHFPSGWLNFTFELKAMAFNANLYQRYMQHWNTLYGDRILTLNYRDIVSDVEAASHQLAEQCGVDWIPEMASPERNKAKVRTASVVQVRQGVHKKSLGGWRAMEPSLRPFIDALDRDLWPDLD
ncbi:Tetratricopeptide (TPR) repeat [Shimia gijangensis]|uniref:Tetratricopeptide (TPR) repeat n=1 Tax=Shimia gijangensis TaxID=1470563 RepID=A0A1M6PEJ6_9RHOB|nr:tetratricopeptide repeat-containing sulfotransferase family protein [Shimia gijangensis]SHK06341.1 Tetratricopeptide (TPR) repeat [Shimia gijangensis]